MINHMARRQKDVLFAAYFRTPVKTYLLLDLLDGDPITVGVAPPPDVSLLGDLRLGRGTLAQGGRVGPRDRSGDAHDGTCKQ